MPKFVFVHGTGIPNTDEDRDRIQGMLDAHPNFNGWEAVCPAWGKALGGTWGNPADALPPELRGVGPESLEDADFDPLVDALGAEVAEEFENPSEGSLDDEPGAELFGQKRLLAAATTIIAKNREKITVAAGNFIRNVFFYFHEREGIRDWVANEIVRERAEYEGPMVVAGHSLGGVIAIDALTAHHQARTLVVTAGSQMPLFTVLRLAEPLGGGGVQPFKPWLNFYNPRDPLSFYASTVFPPEPVFPVGSGRLAESPVDRLITQPKHLPGVHTGYFERTELYDGIWDRLGALGYLYIGIAASVGERRRYPVLGASPVSNCLAGVGGRP